MIIPIIIIAIVLIFLILKFKNFKINVSNPIFIFCLTWILALFLCLIGIFSNYAPLTLKTIAFIILNLLVVIIGFFLGKTHKHTFKKIKYSQNRLLIAFNVLTIIVISAFIITILKNGTPPILNGSLDKSQYYLENGGEIFYLLVYLAFFLGVYLINYGTAKKIIIPQLIILLIIIFLKSNKTGIFIVLLILLFFFGKKITLFKLVGIFLGIIIIFGIYSTMYYNSQNSLLLKTTLISLTGYKLPLKYFIFFNPLIYLCCNLYNLNGLVTYQLGGIGNGVSIFSGLFHFISNYSETINNLLQNVGISEFMTLQIQDFNTFSGLGSLYVGLGMTMSLIVMFIIGFASGFLYQNKSNQNLIILFFNFMLFITLSLNFFTFYLGNIEVLTNLIAITIIHFMCKEIKNECR